MSDVAVRTARQADAAAVGRIQAEVWHSAYDQVLSADVLAELTPERLEQVWRDSLQSPPSPRHRLMVATEGQDIIGFVALVPLDEQTATIAELDVLPEARRHGHGSRLLNAAVDTLVANDFSQVEVWPLATDESGRAFLEQAGLHPDGAWRDRTISADGDTAREVRLTAVIGDPPDDER